MKYPEDFINKNIVGNSVELMKLIPDNSIDLTVTSPPYDCYSDDTEVLTVEGWKLIKDVSLNEKVLTLNPNTDEIYFCNVIDKFKYNIDDTLISFKNTVIDLLVTKNHNMYVTGRDNLPVRERKPFINKNKLKSSFIKSAENIKKSDILKNTSFKWKGQTKKYFHLPELKCIYNRQNKTFNTLKIEMSLWVKFMGIYLAEGSARGTKSKSTRKRYAINIKQKGKYETNLIRELLEKLPFKFSERFQGEHITIFEITDRQLWEYLYKFGNSYQKYIPDEIKILSKKYLKDFLLYYLIGDGTRKADFDYKIENFPNATSFSHHLLSDLQEIYIKLGYYSKITKYHRIHPIFYKKIKYSNMMIEEIPYRGFVVCLQVEKDNIIYVRRKNKAVFCGNCLRTYKGKIKDNIKFNELYSFPFQEMAQQLFRITKKGGIVVWVVNDQIKDGGESGTSFRMALYFQEIGFQIYDTMIYHKNGPPFPETGRYSQVFEYMFVFSKGKPNTVNLLKDKENRWVGFKNFGPRSARTKEGNLREQQTSVVPEYSTRYNVWHINNGKGYTTKDDFAFEHPALFPESLAEDHILSWTKEGDIVLDPMCGGGTTPKMAKLNNRNFIGIDINEEYINISNKRIQINPYTEESPNPKSQFIVSRDEMSEKRKETRMKNKLKKMIENHNKINQQFENGEEIDKELTKNFVTFPIIDPEDPEGLFELSGLKKAFEEAEQWKEEEKRKKDEEFWKELEQDEPIKNEEPKKLDDIDDFWTT